MNIQPGNRRTAGTSMPVDITRRDVSNNGFFAEQPKKDKYEILESQIQDLMRHQEVMAAQNEVLLAAVTSLRVAVETYQEILRRDQDAKCND